MWDTFLTWDITWWMIRMLLNAWRANAATSEVSTKVSDSKANILRQYYRQRHHNDKDRRSIYSVRKDKDKYKQIIIRQTYKIVTSQDTSPIYTLM